MSQKLPTDSLNSKILGTTVLEWFIVLTLILLCAFQVYFFLVIPQNWSLMDDYGWARGWSNSNFNRWQAGLELISGLTHVGRFRVIDPLVRVARFEFLPVTPKAFHAGQFLFYSFSLYYLYRFLRSAGAQFLQSLFALCLVIGSLCFKDGIVHATSAEVIGVAFLMPALFYYQNENRWLGALFYIAAILSKETFFISLPLFFIIEIFNQQHSLRPEEKNSKKQSTRYLALLFTTATTIGLLAYIKSLPRAYTSGFNIDKLAVSTVWFSFFLPAIKSLGPALILLLFPIHKFFKSSVFNWRLGFIGLFFTLSYTLTLSIWGYFDSWFYLHIPIPFGWSMIIASISLPKNESRLNKPYKIILGLTSIYLLISVVNGGRNYSTYFQNAKVAAEIACSKYESGAPVKVYSNCNEGSQQLREYLLLNKKCADISEFSYYSKSNYQELESPFVLIISKKCDPFDLNSVPTNISKIELDQFWTVFIKH